MKEIIERINNLTNTTLSFLAYVLLGFVSIGGFFYGGLALSLIMLERGMNPIVILMSVEFVRSLFGIIIVVLVFKLILLLLKKVIPILERSSEKQRDKKKKEFVKIIREAVREELKTKTRRKK